VTFARPTFEALIAQVEADLASRLGLGPLHRRSVLAVLARSVAALAHSGHGHLEHLAGQMFPQTSTGADLERHASLRGLFRKSATFATGAVTLSGTPGSTVPSGARFSRADGTIYELLAQVTLGAGGAGAGAVEAVLPGIGANGTTGTVLALQGAYAGVSSTASAGELAGGADQETDDELRARVLASWRARPMAGTAEDYVAWALEVPGITRAWCLPRTPTLGEVTVYVVADTNAPTIAPTSAQLLEVQEHIDAVRPVTARALVLAPALAPLDLSIQLTPNTPALRAAVAASVAEAIRRDAVPGGTIRLSRLAEAVATTPGEVHHRITSPATDQTVAAGTIFVPGDITWL
jgi:uncharacterized phage protein gp47/JayE